MIDINLLPWRKQREAEERSEARKQLLLGLLLSFIVVFLTHLLLTNEWDSLKERHLQMQTRVERVNKILAEVKELYPSLSYQKIPEMDLRLILKQQQELLLFLRKIADEVPATIVLQQIRYEKSSWWLEGFSTELQAILSYMEHLNTLRQGGLKKQNYLDIKEKEGLFHFQFQLEPKACLF